MIRKLIYNNKIMLTIWIILFLSFIIIGSMRLVHADESIQYNKSFTAIEIKEGDTLTSIAEEYAPSVLQHSDYIKEMKSINNLTSDSIHTGCYLLIPIYQVVEE